MNDISKPEQRAESWAKLWLLLGALVMASIGLMAANADKPLLCAATITISLVCVWVGIFAPPRIRQALAWLLP